MSDKIVNRIQQCRLCQNYQKPVDVNTDQPENNPCFKPRNGTENNQLYRGTAVIRLTCAHFSYIESARVTLTARGRKRAGKGN